MSVLTVKDLFMCPFKFSFARREQRMKTPVKEKRSVLVAFVQFVNYL